MDLTKLEELNRQRRDVRRLLSPIDVADALASYYALWHDPRRTKLILHRNTWLEVDGFVAVCQTGADLFRPLVTMRATDASIIPDLLHEALTPGRPYHLVMPVTLASTVQEHLEITKSGVSRLYILDPARFQPVVNVLVQSTGGTDRALRFQIESQGKIVAIAGTNWLSPTFAEVFVYVHPEGRGRGWGRSVVSACTAALLEERLRPLYNVEDGHSASIRIAESLGYEDSGRREFSCEAQMT